MEAKEEEEEGVKAFGPERVYMEDGKGKREEA